LYLLPGRYDDGVGVNVMTTIKRKGFIKKSEMKDDVNYILCPDKKCGLFYTSQPLACEHGCPNITWMYKIIICGNCKEPILLPGDHHFFRRVEHDCKDGRHPWMFSRMSGKYQLIYGISDLKD
jgi:hypothetical protein